ncbi:aldo/keto reductase [Sphingobacteriaceae bacterium]|nr:aldo/keto reductase [Sphingobacteriaceae bacterium]
MIQRIIPSSGKSLPVIGLGTWQSFDVANASENSELTSVLTELHAQGGKLIDSSPMYGKSEMAIGDLTEKLVFKNDLFYATKVWTNGRDAGVRQMEDSMEKMNRSTMDLMQIHNLTDWKTHLSTLRDWKEKGIIHYIGITHYTDSMHEELEKIIRKEPIDFVQFNYSIDSRHAEKRILDASADNGVATLINRPFGEGRLFQLVKDKQIPEFAKELGIENWSAYFLKFLMSHPAVTCVIPATSNPAHAKDNFTAGNGELPDAATRKRMLTYLNM